jgi:GGDEF domain-containing protein
LHEPGFGGLILAKFDWLEDIHSKYGYQGRDQINKELSERMQAELPGIAGGVIARIANTEFAFLLTKSEYHQIETYLKTLIRIINQKITKAGCIANSKFALGVSQQIDNMQPSDLLSQSDNALQQALKEGKISHWFDAQQPQKYCREQWRTKLVDAINKSYFMFQWQAVNDMHSDNIIQRELYCRLNTDDKVVSASKFMPFIELLSLGGQLERCLQDPEFAQWLGFLQQSKHAPQMLFKMPESIFIHSFIRTVSQADGNKSLCWCKNRG